MSHEIATTDSLVLRDKAAWHGLGTIIEHDVTAVQACEQYGLGWNVDRWPIFTKNPLTGELVEVDTHRANVRLIDTPEGPTPSILGLTGEDYQVCQNRELAEFMDALAQTGKVVIETAGSIRGGKRVWFLARSDAYDMPGGDKSYSYLLGSNAHDGTGSIRLDPTDIRVVCKNTLNMVLPVDAVERSSQLVEPAAITIRHSGKLANKLEEARRAIREFDRIKQQHRELVAQLAEKRIDRTAAMAYFAQRYSETFVVADEEDDRKTRDRRNERMDKAAAAFMQRYNAEVAQFGGASAWLALNAWTGYCQHDLKSTGKSDGERRENRIRSTLFGVGAQRTAIALADAVAEFLAV
jgi:phage/plasmid-like protein (TIGR03299 family)